MADSSRPVTHAQLATGFEHVTRLRDAVLRLDIGKLQQWGRQLVTVFDNGGRLLAAGNGGSAAEAQHLTSELVGRMRDERRPLSAIALHGDGPRALPVARALRAALESRGIALKSF